jgi:GxxExxY protein
MNNISGFHRDERTYAIIGAAMEVHRTLHKGFLEVIYCEALAHEFDLRGIPFRDDVPCAVQYKGRQLRGVYRMDFVCYDEVVVEVKAVSMTSPPDHAQVLNYLAVSGRRTGLLINFGRSSLEHRRFVLGDPLPGAGI